MPLQRPNPALEYAIAADVDQLYEGLFQTFNKYTDHLPTKNRLRGYVVNRWVIVNRRAGRILGAVYFQLEGPRVNYNYLWCNGIRRDLIATVEIPFGLNVSLKIREGSSTNSIAVAGGTSHAGESRDRNR